MTNPPRDDAPETIWLGYDYAKAIGGKKPRYGNNVEYRRADTPARAGKQEAIDRIDAILRAAEGCDGHVNGISKKDLLSFRAALLPTEAGPPEVQITKLDRPITMDEIEKWDSGCNPTPPTAPTDTALVDRAYKLADWCEGAGERDASEAASTLRELAAALASRAAPPEAQVTVAEDGWLFMHNTGHYEAFRNEEEAIQEADKYDRRMTVEPFYLKPPPRVIAENQLAAAKRTMIREAFTTGMEAALRALAGGEA